MSIWGALAEIEKKNETAALCAIVDSQGSTPRHTGSKMIVFPDGHILGTVGGGEMEDRVIHEALTAMRDGKPRRLTYTMSEPDRGDPGVCGGSLEIYVEPITPKPSVIVVGAGHVGRAVAHLAHWLGYHVAVSDDRVELCNPEVVPEADEFFAGPLVDLPEHLVINSQTHLVLTTRGVDVDVPGLPVLLDTPAAYIGVIGSRRRWKTTREQLEAKGISSEKLDRIKSPMGMEIGAETPEEIAISILSEIIQQHRNN